ncbi:MAG: CehA/McbA family metallohydrolase, partial [bacterium]
MKYIPFDTPSGVTRLVIHKEFDHGAHPELKNTVDLGLFDPGGYGEGGPGFRAWQGGSPDDLIVAGTVEASSPHAIPGPIPAGTWHLAQYFLKSTPEGLGYKYTITFYFDGEKPPQNRVPVPAYSAGVIRRKTSWYAGNMHAHTIHSDGGYTLDNLVARNERAGFDFLASTEHNSPTAHYRFAEVGRDHPDHLLLCGDELTTPSGHANIIGQPPGKFYDFRIDAGDGKLSRRIDEVHRDGGFFTVNHPFAPCTSCFWKYYDDEWKEADAIEVWNNLWTPEDRLAVDKWDSLLKAGRRISAIGGTDYHRGEDMMSPATLIFAPELSRRAILDNLRRGHIILTQSPRSGIECNFALNNRDVLPGDEITVKGDTISLAMALTVRCKNNSDAPKKLRLIYATGERSFDLNATETKLTLDY